jgi:protocatechuate 3,4-dioxygenase beta subunit
MMDAGRRRFLVRAAAGSLLTLAPGAFAEPLALTPRQTEGPFYPDKLPLDTDNDLLIVNDSITQAVGEPAWLSGRILDRSGSPVRNATVEIWQADGNGAYLHTKTGNREKRDGNFQGFGRFVTGSDGRYLFRTIKPVPYPGRAPHIHFAVKRRGDEKLTTQCYIQGHPGNAGDGVLRRTPEGPAKRSLEVAFRPLAGSRAGELTASFDIVLGWTPHEES